MDAAARPAARTARLALALLAPLGFVGACHGDDDAGVAGVGSLDWRAAAGTVEAATLAVPLDHGDPDGPTIELYLARRPAGDPARRIGTLLVNPGGPGFGGSDLALLADRAFGAELLERFDIVGWDPRGTGRSTPAIDCIDDHDAALDGLDTTPDDDAERARYGEELARFAEGCAAGGGDLLRHAGTNDAARDMDAIRQALGEDTVSYFGFSYGSELGAVWATMFPDTVRAAVLDGALDPGADAVERAHQRAVGFETAIDRYLRRCSADAACAFHNGGQAAAAFDELMARLDAAPIPGAPERPDVTREIALRAVAQAMYAEAYWDQLSRALAAATAGDGAGLLALWDAYEQRRPDGTWSDALEAGQVITCADHPVSAADAEAWRAELAASAPRYAPGLAGLDICPILPPAREPRVEITGAGAGPLLVIGTTGDPATPLDGARAMADALEDGRLLVVGANQHTGYQANGCVDDVVHRYLLQIDLPAAGVTC